MTTVGDVMSKALLTLDEQTTLTEAAAAMTARRVGSALVLRDERLAASITPRDLLPPAATPDRPSTRGAPARPSCCGASGSQGSSPSARRSARSPPATSLRPLPPG